MQYSVTNTDGNTYGPVDFQTLKLWAAEGRVKPDSMITDGLANMTFQASTMAELGLSATFTDRYGNVAPPPSSEYIRAPGVPAKQGTRLWSILFWLVVALALCAFTRTGGVIIAAWNIFDAFTARSRGDKHATTCIAVALIGCLIVGGVTYFKVTSTPVLPDSKIPATNQKAV